MADDDDDHKYYEQQLMMFQMPGWKYFTDQVREMRLATDKLAGVKLDDVRFRQGELSIIDWILGWQQQITVAAETHDTKPTE